MSRLFTELTKFFGYGIGSTSTSTETSDASNTVVFYTTSDTTDDNATYVSDTDAADSNRTKVTSSNGEGTATTSTNGTKIVNSSNDKTMPTSISKESEKHASHVEEPENEDPKTLFEQGERYYKGIEAAPDLGKALKYYQQAANQDYKQAKDRLTEIYKQYKELVVHTNDPSSQCTLGVLYYHGYGTSIDYKKAFKLFKKSSENKIIQSTYNLALMYAYGKGVDKDEIKAFELYHSAAERGQKDAKVKFESVFKEYQKAAAEGNVQAKTVLENVMTPKDKKKDAETLSTRDNQTNESQDRKGTREELESYCLQQSKYHNQNKTQVKSQEQDQNQDQIQQLVETPIDNTERTTYIRLIFSMIRTPGTLFTIVEDGVPECIKTILSKYQNLDFRGISFIHLVEALPDNISKILMDNQNSLRKLGAIFTLNELEDCFCNYMNQAKLKERDRFLDQMRSSMMLILDLWRKGALKNSAAVQQLDEESIEILDKHLWPVSSQFNSTNIELKDGANNELVAHAFKKLAEQKRIDIKSWLGIEQPSSLSHEAEEELEHWLKYCLWQAWNMNPNDKFLEHLHLQDKVVNLQADDRTIFLNHLENYYDAIIYRNTKNCEDNEGKHTIILSILEDKINKIFDAYCLSTNNIETLLKALCLRFIHYRSHFLAQANNKIAASRLADSAKLILEVHENALQEMIKDWKQNRLSKEEEQGIKILVDSIPRKQIFGEGMLDAMMLKTKAVAELLEDCKQKLRHKHSLKNIDLKSSNEKVEVKMCFERGKIEDAALNALSLCLQATGMTLSLPEIPCEQHPGSQTAELQQSVSQVASMQYLESQDPQTHLPMSTEGQKAKVCKQILEEWKKAEKSVLPANIQALLEMELLKKWNKYLKMKRRGNKVLNEETTHSTFSACSTIPALNANPEGQKEQPDLNSPSIVFSMAASLRPPSTMKPNQAAKEKQKL